MSYVFRNRLKKHNKVSDIVSGLVNYRKLNVRTRPIWNSEEIVYIVSDYARDLVNKFVFYTIANSFYYINFFVY